MSYLLDTNIISETIKKQPNQIVISWLKKVDMDKLFLSVITLGEIRKGIENIADNKKKNKIMNWLEIDLAKEFTGRILAIDLAVADKWGYISAAIKIPAIDALIGATALVNNLKLVTRNTKDFINIPGLEIINPWGK
jgi:predicted nucleic acid-binding protein